MALYTEFFVLDNLDHKYSLYIAKSYLYWPKINATFIRKYLEIQ